MRYSFSKENKKSRNATNEIKEILKEIFPMKEFNETEAGGLEDKEGIDYWLVLNNGKRLAIEVKVRKKDFRKNDVALETWSDYDKKTIGWTLDSNKKSDFVLIFWIDSKKWCLFPFDLLREVFIIKKDEWVESFKTDIQTSSNGNTWRSQCVFVPIDLIWQEIIKRYTGYLKEEKEWTKELLE